MKIRLDLFSLAVLATAIAIATTQGYVRTTAEPDLARMLVGLVYGGATGQHLKAAFHYGSEFSFGYYELLYRVLPEPVLHDPDALAEWFNRTAVVFGSLFALALALMLARLAESRVALFVTTAFLLSPGVLPFMVSGHPMVAALAFLFLGTWLILRCSAGLDAASDAIWLGLALLALTAGLSFRADIALAFPFVAMAPLARERQAPLRAIVAGGALVAAAFACFLYLQRPFVPHGGTGALRTFLADFTSLGRVARGGALLVLGLGLATAVALPVIAWVQRQELRRNWRSVLLAAILALPSLVFWLPNPQPARHLLVPVLGLYLLLGLAASAVVRNDTRALAAGLALALGNQALAEAVRPLIVRNYPWQYAAAGERRSSQQAPLGYFPFDQVANRRTQAILRQEAIDLVARRPRDLVVMADHQSYMVMRLIADDPSLRLSQTVVDGVDMLRLFNKQRNIYFVEKYVYWPRDILGNVLASAALARFPVYVQQSTISRYDRTAVPPARRYPAIGLAAAR